MQFSLLYLVFENDIILLQIWLHHYLYIKMYILLTIIYLFIYEPG